MDQKTQFIADYLRKRLSITELCELYGISQKTGYKLIDRYPRLGLAKDQLRSSPMGWPKLITELPRDTEINALLMQD